MANVLLLEPDMVLARAYTQALQHAGYKASHAANAQDAIDAADANAPDIVVLELQLSVHNGIEFLHEFRSYPEWQGVPVVVNTHMAPSALTPVKDALEGDLGVTVCLYKPRTSLEQLLRVIKQQIANV